ncbi:MAG: bile acid:sodium symporter family protein, partial [Nitrososphaerales archaeon]
MFSVGLTIPLKEFSSTRNKVIPATLTQWIMPLVGYLVGRILGVPPEVILGLVILGAVSNDITSSVFVKITARSASLSALVTITSTVASLFILPLSALLLLGQVFEFDPSSILFGLLIFVLIPLLVGLFLRTRGLHVDENKALGLASLALIVLIGISSSQISIGFLVIPIILASLLMNLAGYAIGYGSAKHFKYDVASGIYLVGLREFGVAMTVLIVADLPIEALTVPIVYGIVQTFTATVLSKYIRK